LFLPRRNLAHPLAFGLCADKKQAGKRKQQNNDQNYPKHMPFPARQTIKRVYFNVFPSQKKQPAGNSAETDSAFGLPPPTV
ncbi:hypothetical protein MM708_29560, partial [Klebsiella pneumoniae]|nr:hypothetical protein [Klebsiella pneumoniae]